MRPRRVAFTLCWMALGSMSARGAEETSLPLLTNAQQVFKLGVEGALRQQNPVRLTAVVTCPVTRRPWFYVQDNTAGILVLFTNNLIKPAAGRVVEIEGIAIPGLYASHVMAERIRVVGTGSFPEPHRTDASRLTAGEDFGQWVSIEGQVLDMFLHPEQLSLLLGSGNYHFIVNISRDGPMQMPLEWLGARIEVRGVAWTEASSKTQPVGFRIHTPSTNFLSILKPGNSDPFAGPLRTAHWLRDRVGGSNERSRVVGTVTFFLNNRVVVLQDDTGAVQANLLRPITQMPYISSINADVLMTELFERGAPYMQFARDRSFSSAALQPGDRIEIIGTPVSSALGAILADAEYRRLGAGALVSPRLISGADFLSGRHEGELVKIRGRLVDRESHQTGSALEELLLLREGDLTIQANYASDLENKLPRLALNSLLEVTGVCASEAGEWKTVRTQRLLLRGPADIRVLGQPAVWESWRVGRILSVVGALGLAALIWIWFLQHRVAIRTAELGDSARQLQAEIEERKRAQAELARALEAEKELSQLKSRFVSMVSHEFRTPLGVILSSADLLSDYQDTLTPEERAEQLTDIKQSTQHMASLMEDVLVLGQVEVGTMQCRPFELDLSAFCHRLVDEILSATGRACPVELQERELSGNARGDETLLRHIILNLLSNAIKYSPPGVPVTFSVAREGDDAVFTVKDDGLGIPAEDHKHIFDAFYRGKNVGERAGSGLGLVIVKRCVELQGGRISFESREGHGTTFTVRLPLFVPPGQTEFAQRVKPQPNTTTTLQSSSTP